MLDNLSAQMKGKLGANEMCFYRRILRIRLTEQHESLKEKWQQREHYSELGRNTRKEELENVTLTRQKEGKKYEARHRSTYLWRLCANGKPNSDQEASQIEKRFLGRRRTGSCVLLWSLMTWRGSAQIWKRTECDALDAEMVEGDIILVNRKIFERCYSS